MSSLFALLSQQSPLLKTRKALIVVGLQNDAIDPLGKLPISNASGWLNRIEILVSQFRSHGDVVWVRSEYRENRPVRADGKRDDAIITSANGSVTPNARHGSTDVEHYLTQSADACLPGSWGAAYSDSVKDLITKPKDIDIVKTQYSAFEATSLLITLRSKLVTELYICGCHTNLSVYATAVDAARYGMKVTLVEDCLGYRQKDRHDLAVQRLVSIMSAGVMKSTCVIDVLLNPPAASEIELSDDDDEDEESDESVAEDEEPTGPPVPANTQDLLAVDSGEDVDEEAVLPTMSSLNARRLELRYSSAERPTSRTSAMDVHDPARRPPARPSVRESNSAEDTHHVSSGSHGQHRARRAGFDRRSEKSSTRDSVEVTFMRRSSSNSGMSKGEVAAQRKSVKDVKMDGRPCPKKARSAESWLEGLEPASPRVAVSQETSQPLHPGLAAMSKLCGLPQATITDYQRMMDKARRARALLDLKRCPEQKDAPLLGEGNEEASAGSRILRNLLSDQEAETIFDNIHHEVDWQTMYHQTGEVPRLVCCQGTIEADGTVPIYRHPSDQTIAVQPWSVWVEEVRKAAEQAVGHDLNHVLIQLYRNGSDFISEHTDKTLDIARDSNIVNVSFGAKRTMRLRAKRGAPASSLSTTLAVPQRTIHRIPLPHNSMLSMSMATNAEYLHGISADKRPTVELSDAEKAYNGQRISLTFRKIGTFLTPAPSSSIAGKVKSASSTSDAKPWLIFGQGAKSKTRDQAHEVLNGVADASEQLIRAFGRENQYDPNGCFDWKAVYGEGSDVLHLK